MAKAYGFNFPLLDSLMKERGLTSEDLSDRMHKSEGLGSSIVIARNIQRWRTGEVTPNEGFIKRIANYFGTSADSFYTQSVDVPKSSGYQHFLHQSLKREAIQALAQSDVFDKIAYKKIFSKLLTLDEFRGMHPNDLASEVELDKTSGSYVGLYDSEEANEPNSLWRSERLVVSLPVSMIAALLVFTHLKTLVPTKITIRLTCCAGPDVIAEMRNGTPDLVVLPYGSSTSVIHEKQVDYSPVMLMPSGSYAIIGRKLVGGQRHEALLLVSERPSSAMPFVQEALRNNEFPKTKLIHRENADAFSAVKQRDSRLASAHWFPFYAFATLQGVSVLHRSDPTSNGRHALSTFLFVKSDIIASRKKIDSLTRFIRRSWLDLRRNEQLLDYYIRLLCTEDNGYYPRAIERCSGFFDIKGD